MGSSGGVVIDVEKRVTDTIGYEPVLKYFKDRDYKKMFLVPGVAGKEFDLEIGTVEKVQGLLVPTFEAKTEKRDVLNGMNISLGSLDEVTTGGNWPPSYDKKQGAKKEK